MHVIWALERAFFTNAPITSAAGSEAPKRCGAWCVVSKMRMALEAWFKACEGWEEEDGVRDQE